VSAAGSSMASLMPPTREVRQGRLRGNRLKPPLLRTTGETSAVRNPGRISARRKQGGPRSKALRAKRNLPSTPWSSVVLPASSVLKTLRTSHLHGRRDARPRVNRSDRTPTQFKRLSWGRPLQAASSPCEFSAYAVEPRGNEHEQR
jgi:hypothetical protein